ncbi:NAD(P)/FAD-dependent oxidoreductase [Bacillus kwashiorkori]|uniref:NAD(P)/FAD-dependent oxidoreductase n=1 Tax=Bacillus kwashiorkori TaxID=1522318 RepID=UPI000785E05E|nr:FAD-dependent oxidoreductase [Bacillus kwashiorkori]
MSRYAVIGAGVLGAATAYHLAKTGKNVIVIDQPKLGQATDAAAGVIAPWINKRRNKAWYMLAKTGAAYYPSLINELKLIGVENTGYKKVGAIYLQPTMEKVEQLKTLALSRKMDAPEIGEVKILSATETTDYHPLVEAKMPALYVSGAAQVNGRNLRESLLQGAKKFGATVVYGWAKMIDQHTIKADETYYEVEKLIVTAGAWAKEILQPLGIDVKISSQKGQILHLQMKNQLTGEFPVLLPANNQYILTFANSELVIGSTNEDNQHFNIEVTVAGIYEILHKAIQVAPKLLHATFLEARVGFRPHTPQYLPVIGQLPHYPNIYFANGLGASGLTIGPYFGEQLAKLASNQLLDIDVSLYSVHNAF